MNWEILGIAPTDDTRAITSAYRNRLLQVNPEEKPEEFKALRAAYEAALEEAKKLSQPREEAGSADPLEEWVRELQELYSDFSRRIRPEWWQALLEHDLCVSLDTRALAEEALLKFLMERYYLPRPVWLVLDGHFGFSDRISELYESYPKDFVDHVIVSGIHSESTMPYELFAPGEDGESCDELRRLYYQFGGLDEEQKAVILKKVMASHERHPYWGAISYLEMIHSGNADEGRQGLQELVERYPTDATLNMAWINENPGDWELSEAVADRVLAAHPKYTQLRVVKAECLARRGEYDDAKDIIFALIHEAGGDQVRQGQLYDRLRRWNEQIIRDKEAILAADPGDSAAARSLAWCYLQNEDIENAARAAQMMDEAQETAFDYHNLLGKVAYARERTGEALPHFESIVALLEEAREDTNHPAAKHSERLADFLQITGTCLMAQGRPEEAMKLYARAMELAPEDPTALDHMGRMYFNRRDYENAAETYRKLSRLNPRNYHAFLMMAMNLYELGRDREAFDAINRALDLERSDLTVYVTKMRILLRNGVWDEVREMLSFLARAGVGEELTVCWCAAMLAEFADKDTDSALKAYRAIAARMEQGENLPWPEDLYYRIAVLSAKNLNMNKPEDRSAMLQMLEKCLEFDPDHEDALDYKAWLFRREKKREEALAIYRSLEARPRHSLNVELGLAQMYYDTLRRDADKALKYYLHLLRHRENADYHFYAATCLRYTNDLEAAAEHFLRELEIAPEDVDGYNGMAYVLEAQGRYEEALAQMDKALGCIKGKESKYAWVFNHKAQILRRMGRVQDAIDLLSVAVNIHGAKGCFETRFETCCQFGRWDQAKTALNHWIQVEGNTEQNAEAGVSLQLYQGKMLKATVAFAGAAKHLSDSRQDEIKMQVAELEGNPERALKVWTERYRTDSENTRTLGCLAHAQWLCGHYDEARKTAELLLNRLDGELAKYNVDAALYRSQRVRPLAMLGRLQEAKADLEAARMLPLCSFCAYGGCKDADVYEAEMAEIAGEFDKALALFRAGAEKWPDELDFAAGIARLTKKGKKKV